VGTDELRDATTHGNSRQGTAAPLVNDS